MQLHVAQDEVAPQVPVLSLDNVWFQITGTLCNLRCTHCFISCAPDNHAFGFMSAELIRERIAEADRLGVKAFYFTGGEPFMHPQIAEILAAALEVRPTTVLTNATLFRERDLDRLAEASRASPHELTFRVSIDGHDAQMNDAIRGPGGFEKAMAGVRQLVERGFRPIVTVVRTWCGCDNEVLARFARSLEAVGYAEPRLKVLPSLKLGAEARRTRGYSSCERVTREMMRGYDVSQLLCANTRMVTDRGVWVCPILLDAPDARMGETLADSLGPYPLRHAACTTCYHNGAICSNSTTSCSG